MKTLRCLVLGFGSQTYEIFLDMYKKELNLED